MSSQLETIKPFEARLDCSVTSESNPGTIRVMIVNPSTIVREGLAAIINRATDMSIVAQASDGSQALEISRRERPDVILTDLVLPGMSGVEFMLAISRERPPCRVIILTAHARQEDIYRALQAGASSYLLQDTTGENLQRTIRAVAVGQRLLSDSIAARLAERAFALQLTERELEVLSEIAKGRSNKGIAASLGISESTVKGHINNILSKMAVNDRTQAVTTALQRGLIHLD